MRRLISPNNYRQQPHRQAKDWNTFHVGFFPTPLSSRSAEGFCRYSISRGLDHLLRWLGPKPKIGKSKEKSRGSLRVHKTMTWASKAQGEREGPNASPLSERISLIQLISESGPRFKRDQTSPSEADLFRHLSISRRERRTSRVEQC